MLLWLCLGFVIGVLFVLLLQIWYFFAPFSRNGSGESGSEFLRNGAQFSPFRIPHDLKRLLISPGCEEQLKKKETCVCLNLFVQFLFQEFRDSKTFRRWMVKRLQMEFNELLSRTAAGRLIQDIKLKSFSLGIHCPVIKEIRVGRVTLSNDKDSFQDLDLLLEIDYRGGFELSVDILTLLTRQASLSVRVTRLAGQARLQLTRTPYCHWSFAFTREPVMEFKVESAFRGRPLPQLVPLIINQVRRTVRKKHVLPAYKFRYRPFFVNPWLQPSADPSDFTHVQLKGAVRVTIVKCTRLNIGGLVPANLQNSGEIYCVLTTGVRPSDFGRQRHCASTGNPLSASQSNCDTYISMALRYVRHSSLEPFGLTLNKEYIAEKVGKMSVVSTVTEGSLADRAGFKKGDLIIAVNNIGITTDKQAVKLMSNTVGEMQVLLERKLSSIDNEDDLSDHLPSNIVVETRNDDDFVHINFDNGDSNDSRKNEKVSEDGDRSLSEPMDGLNGTNEDGSPTEQLHKTNSSGILTDSTASKNDMADTKDVEERSAGGSSTSSSPASGRRRNLATKATERVAQVAQRWTTSKATVKDMWDRHQRRKQSEEVTPPVTLLLSNSKSEEAELRAKVMDSKLLVPEAPVQRRPRSRSRSEPDTAALMVSPAPDEETRTHRCSTMSTHSTATETKRTASFRAQTKAVPSVPEPTWYQNFLVPLEEKLRYLNVMVYWRAKESPNVALKTDANAPKPAPNACAEAKSTSKRISKSAAEMANGSNETFLGYTTMFLPETVDDCNVTKSLCHQQTYVLRPPSVELQLTAAMEKLMAQSGFDPRLCYGDVTLQFQWLPDGDASAESTAAAEESIEQQSEPLKVAKQTATADKHLDKNNATKKNLDGDNEFVLSDGHKWQISHFQQSTACDVCQKKVWLKSAYRCVQCGSVSHKKCMEKTISLLGACGEMFETTGIKSSVEKSANDDASTSGAEVATEALEHAIVEDKRSKLHLSERLAGLRRRRGHSGSDKADTKSLADSGQGVSFSSLQNALEGLSDVNWGAGRDNSQFHSLLYTKGGTYNEHMIQAAKDLGKDLFSELPIAERKVKINEQIDRLHSEIDQTTVQRLELMKKYSDKNQNEVVKLDDKLQALAILMLHYCAGLQYCIDAEEGASSSSCTDADSLTTASTEGQQSVGNMHESGDKATVPAEDDEDRRRRSEFLDESTAISDYGNDSSDSDDHSTA